MLRSDGLGCDGEGGHGDGDGAQIEKLLLFFSCPEQLNR